MLIDSITNPAMSWYPGNIFSESNTSNIQHMYTKLDNSVSILVGILFLLVIVVSGVIIYKEYSKNA